MLLWMDQLNSAEILVAQMGALKTGVSIVTFDEKDSTDAFQSALSDSGARGLIVSPGTDIEGGAKREDCLLSCMPELKSHEPGNFLNVGAFPQLK